MASLDHMEGDAIEAGVLLVVVLIVVAIFLAYMGKSSLLNWLLDWLHRLESWLSNLLHFGGPSGNTFNAAGGGPAVKDVPLDQSIPPGGTFSYPDTAFNWFGYSPNDFLVNSDVPGGVNYGQPNDPGSGVGVSFGGGPWFTKQDGGS